MTTTTFKVRLLMTILAVHFYAASSSPPPNPWLPGGSNFHLNRNGLSSTRWSSLPRLYSKNGKFKASIDQNEHVMKPSSSSIITPQQQQQQRRQRQHIPLLVSRGRIVSSVPRWIHHKVVQFCKSIPQDFYHRIVGLFQVGLVAYICYEMVLAIRDVARELQDEQQQQQQQQSQFDDNTFWGTSRNSNSKQLMTPSAASKLVFWLSVQKESNGQPPPRNVSPLALRVARQLYQLGIPLFDTTRETNDYSEPITTSTSVERILTQLTKTQAEFLLSCLIVPNPSISLSESVIGLDGVRHALQQWLDRRDRYDRWATQPLEERWYQDLSPFQTFVQAASPTSVAPIDDGRRRNGPPLAPLNKGIFLYGPPGCGKSLLIQALCSDSGLPTLVITPSTLQRKWYGDSNQLVRLLFEILDIVRPCILVLDELDGLFRERHDDEHEVSRNIKTEFLNWWQGSVSNDINHHTNDQRAMLVIGASNRPFDVDPAVLRRMPQSYWIGLPTLKDRRQMLWRWAEKHGLLDYVRDYEDDSSPSRVLETMAQATTHYTPSDLWQALQTACLLGPVARDDDELTVEDIWNGLSHVPPTRLNYHYVQQLYQFGSRPHPQTAAASMSEQNSASHPESMGWENWTRVPSTSPFSTETVDDRNRHRQNGSIWKFESDCGNFYHLGHVPVDSDTMEELIHVLDSLRSGYDSDWDSEQDDSWLDELSDDDDDEGCDTEFDDENEL